MMEGALPLQGVRVVDLSMWWSGPFATSILGSMGAEVLKVESVQHVDEFRTAGRPAGRMDQWEVGSFWNATNTSKLGCTLNLRDPEGVRLLKTLVAVSDVVVQNFSSRVMGSLGLEYPVLQAVRPDLVMLSMPSYGKATSWAEHVGWAYSFEQLSGAADATGYPGDKIPYMPGGSADPTIGYLAAFALMNALLHRARTGEGQHIEMPQLNAYTTVHGRRVVEQSVRGAAQGRLGNRDALIAPQGCYPCREADTFIAISIQTDEDWARLVSVMGSPGWAREPGLETVLGRRARHDDIDTYLAAWTRQCGHLELMRTLQGAGIDAGAVHRPDELVRDPHLKERGFFQPLERDLTGVHEFPWFGFRISGTPSRHRGPAPLLGEHNEHVLGELLGLPAGKMEALAQAKVIGWEPIGPLE